jgi:hypothetical protein
LVGLTKASSRRAMTTFPRSANDTSHMCKVAESSRSRFILLGAMTVVAFQNIYMKVTLNTVMRTFLISEKTCLCAANCGRTGEQSTYSWKLK